jgi:hypothetical protein
VIKTHLASAAAAFMLGLAAIAGTVLTGAAAANAEPGHAPSNPGPGPSHPAPPKPADAAPEKSQPGALPSRCWGGGPTNVDEPNGPCT